MKYAQDSPSVLKGVNCVIFSGEKIGVVGRTGAGKSSVLAALFRLAPTTGFVKIDGVTTCAVPLQQLRRGLSVIPQEPVLFSESLRHNLDPFDEHTDAELWQALEDVQLKEYVSRMMNLGLDTAVLEGGSNLSVGQRQLVCLARAILRATKVLLLDEATANIDTATDALIQLIIREKFKHCTVITIAHRLNTIIDSDRIMVLDAGSIVEFDSPQVLLTKPGGVFAELASHVNLVS